MFLSNSLKNLLLLESLDVRYNPLSKEFIELLKQLVNRGVSVLGSLILVNPLLYWSWKLKKSGTRIIERTIIIALKTITIIIIMINILFLFIIFFSSVFVVS